MTMTDPIADMLTRIRNGVHARHPLVEMPSSTVKVEDFTAFASPKLFSSRSTLICAIAYSGIFETMMNITVPVRVVTRDQE